MADYIWREDAVKIADRYGLANGSVLGRHTGLADCIASEISGLPAADVAPVVHGKWIHARYTATDHFEIVKCSKCGYESFAAAVHVMMGHYCPNCGAKVQPYNS